jgi:nucleoside-diphosphate-sugar epimerase
MPFPDGLAGHFLQYQAGKLLGHQAYRDWVKTNNPSFSAISVHPSQVFGPSLVQKTPDDISGVNFLVWATLHGTDPPMMPFMMFDVRDIVDGLVQIAKSNVPSGTELPMTGPRYTWKELADLVKTEYPALDVPFSPEQEPTMTMDASTTERLLGIKWRPMEETIRAYLNQQVAQQET